MSAWWIAGLFVFLLIGVFFALTLCRCAGMADQEVEQYLADKSLSKLVAAGLNNNREE